MESLKAYINTERLFAYCVSANMQGGDPVVSQVMSQVTYAQAWDSLVKWLTLQFDQGRSVICPPLGTFGYMIGESQKTVCLQLSEELTNLPNISGQNQQPSMVSGPSVKLNYMSIAKSGRVDKQIVALAVGNVFNMILTLLQNHPELELDLGPLGSLKLQRGHLRHVPGANKASTPHLLGRSTVRNLVELKRQKEQRLPPLITPQPPQADKRALSASRSARLHSSRKVNQLDISQVTSNMLGAGMNPNARVQSFSMLTNDPGNLITSRFKKPNFAHVRFPPVLDKFSRTQAAPLNSSRQYIPPSSRIASNYNPQGRCLLIDSQTRSLQLRAPEKSIVLETNINPLLQQIPTNEGGPIVAIGNDTETMLRDFNWKRYMHYIENEIGTEHISPIRQYWIQHILDLVPNELALVGKERVEDLLDEMLANVNKDYYFAVRKSILDYVLKDQNQRKRLGISHNPSPPVDYGSKPYQGIEPNEEWQTNVMMARMLMSDNLCINSPATLSLCMIWAEYEQMFLVDLPKRFETLYCHEFIERQEIRMQQVRSLIMNEWTQSAVNAITEEIKQMDREQAGTFFDATSTLMSNQLRQLITDSLDLYVDFIEQFNIETSPEPAEQTYAIPKYWPNAFLKLKMSASGGHFSFAEEPKEVYFELLKVLEMIVEQSESIPRPDHIVQHNESKQFLWAVSTEDDIVMEASKKIKGTIRRNLDIASHSLELYDKFSHLLSDRKLIEKFVGEKHSQKEYQSLIDKYISLEREIRKNCPVRIRVNMVQIECHEINRMLCDECKDIVTILCKNILADNSERATNIYKEFENINNYFNSRADTAEKLVEYEDYRDNCRENLLPQLFAEYEDVKEWFKMLFDIFDVSDDELTPLKQCNFWVKRIMQCLDDIDNRLRNERDQLTVQLKDIRQRFAEELQDIENKIATLRNASERGLYKDYNNQIANLKSRLDNAQGKMEEINYKEELLGRAPTEFSKLEEARVNIKPYDDLWRLVMVTKERRDSWVSSYCRDLETDEIEREAKQMLGTARKLLYHFKDKAPKPLEVAQLTMAEIDKFIQSIPVMKIAANRGLEDRHFREISIILGLDPTAFRIESTTTFKQVQEYKLEQHLEAIEEISQIATRESSNLKMLQSMEYAWEEVRFETKIWAESETYILLGASIEMIQQILDEQILVTQTMKSSPYAQEFRPRIDAWDERLNLTLNIIEVWLRVQMLWISLEPVFASADIQKQLYKEAALFREVDNHWRRIMEQTNKNLLVSEVIKIDNLLDTLKYCQEKLEIVAHELNNYLEKKRLFFPRFFFLSNEELLSILKETRDPKRVKPHLKKCFEGIKSLEFDSDDKILAMISQEGERVEFLRVIDPMLAEGAVERWLIEVEDCMIKSTKESIIRALSDYQKRSRKDWVPLHKGQAVLCASMTYWTRGAEEKMITNGLAGLQEYEKECTDLLNQIVDLVRGEIPELVRCTLKALIVLDVHARDTITSLIQEGIYDKDDFSWLAQLRYYWENENTVVRILNAELSYNYEYLGNSERLVITPLTDKCYRTLCGAVYLAYGGAPEGPAGTGKTETVKDLAKALARMCVVFNCSDGLDYQAMGKFFKGLVATGGWSCFDEFNRIEPDVLSVIAQQLLEIQNAIRENKIEFTFEGTLLPVKKTCNCFITMNPGYAGRSDLPDNLKALFRTVAMMVPDYALISENVLYSYGFREAKPLARKIVATYKLCSEQLSYQPHYDYGMRAVKSVLTAGGNLKQRYPTQNEQILILRAINDVNLAKFLSHDLPLFISITSDLFPGIELPVPDYDRLMECMIIKAEAQNLQMHPYFVEKVIQLYEMICVRHGLMIVGLPFSGKTTAIHLLANTLTECSRRGYMNENEVLTFTLNPKSITAKQLYGSFDEISKDWQDGVLAKGFKEFAKNDSMQRKWLIFDGPVDAIWIENMNTVLDDNRKLCLTSGEIIAMSQNMNLIFEPMDLAVASPATVSRCGMVYVEPHKLGWQPIYESWRNVGIPKTFQDNEQMEISLLVDWLLEPTINYVESKMKLIAPMMMQNLVTSLFRLFSHFLQALADPDDFESMEEKERLKIIDCYFLFCMTWSIGAAVVTDHRRNFNIWMRRILAGDVAEVKNKGKKIVPAIPETGSYYDYIFLTNSLQWRHWSEAGITDINADISPKLQPNEIIVPTIDTIRYAHILEHMIKADIPMLFCGNTGTGKTIYVKDVLMNKLNQDVYISAEIGFSAQTNANQVQDIIDGKVDVRRRKGVYGPPPEKICVIFVDDLNMPEKEYYGAQPPIEILRQLLDQQGWYEHKEMTFKKIVDKRFVSAMGPPGGGRTFITPRFQRHLNMIGLADFEDDTLLRIFSSILHWFFSKNRFNENVTKVENKLVQASRDIYKTAMAKLLPTPRKSHYTFNLRDFARVILGICMSDAQTITETQQMVRLWVHEIFRVFGDRLVDEEDSLWLLSHLRENTKRIFGFNFDTIFSHLDNDKDGKVETLDEIRGLMFGNLLFPPGSVKHYTEITDLHDLKRKSEEALELYNSGSTKPMDLVLFGFALEHLCRISRILNQPGGHGLLVGVGGSGRQSLTTLAASMAEFEVVQIELTKNYNRERWQENLKQFLRKAGGIGDPTVFLITDSQITDKSFLEDINTLLNTGEVPNLFPPDEKIEVCELVRGAARSEGAAPEGTTSQLFSYFINRCKKQLHIILCFSPIGETFKTRLRMFPSLVNCCTIDWFFEWPQDALVSVARHYCQTIDLEDEVKYQCVEMCQMFHRTTIEYSSKMLQELRRHYYVTPTSYIEMISTFKTLLEQKRKEINDERERFEIGYEKIITTEGSVEGMRQYLTELQPKLEIAQIETEKKMEIVEAQKKEAELVKVVVEQEEIVAREAADKAEAIKQECDAELAQCMPILEDALSALNTLKDDDINTIKNYKNPPTLVKDVMEAVCILLKEVPPKKQDPNTMKMVPQWWEASLKALSRQTFLRELKDYDKNAITDRQVKQLQRFINDPEFNKNNMRRKVDTASAGLCAWVIAMERYFHVYQIVEPKQKAQAEAQADFNKVMSALKQKQQALQAEEAKVKALQDDLQKTEAYKFQLEQDVEDCKRRLVRAQQLIESLGGEKTSWKEKARMLGYQVVQITGDVLVSSGFIGYLGPFTAVYRNKILDIWSAECKERQIPSNDIYSFSNCLGDPVKIRSWNIDGLPRDQFSIDNGIIISISRRWPLMIDPECQANKWIKKMENKEGRLMILKLTDDNFLRYLETSITLGKPVLIENVGEELDPSLEPLLLKQIYKNTIKIGEKPIEYSPDFKLYVTTRLRSPHYLPELSTKVTLLNFMITPEGLSDQLLATVVAEEQPELERTKEQLIIKSAENQQKLKETQDKILYVLSTSQGSILDDDEAIQILSQSKMISNQIEEEQNVAKETEVQIDAARLVYKPFAECMALLFFCITDLGNIDAMYQYSIDFFNYLFIRSIRESEASDDVPQRLQNLEKYFTKSLYINICRSLFEKDRLLFAFTLCLKFLEFRGTLDKTAVRFFMTGGISIDAKLPEKPNISWLNDKMWTDICLLSDLPSFKNFNITFVSKIDEWEIVYNSLSPFEEHFPTPWQTQLSNLERLLILRCLRPDAVVASVTEFVTHELGKEYTDPIPFKLKEVYKDSSRTTPLIFILSPGSDPLQALKKFADSKRKNLETRSLGQGQGDYAATLIQRSLETGDWVLLQNCHLAVNWMPTLEKIVSDIPAEAKGHGRDFRLWLTSYTSDKFPVTLLQNGMKMTNEPPKGLKANLLGSFNKDFISDPQFFNGCKQEFQWRKLLFGLCFFNAVIQERRLYGPLGWNIPYEFTESDLRISVQQLQIFLNQYDGVPFKALTYLTGVCNFGGRVTDDKDQRLILTLLDDYYTEQIFEEDYKFCAVSPDYYAPTVTEFQDYVRYIENLPPRAPPEIYGFHPNADITKNLNEAYLLFDSLLLTISSASNDSAGGSQDQKVKDIAKNILSDLPEEFNEAQALHDYPPDYNQSMNTVLTQEVHRFNVLTDTIKGNLHDILDAIQGRITMSATIDASIRSLFDGRVPKVWMDQSYPSLKTLAGYIADLKLRLEFFNRWLANGVPDVFNISLFYFTQGFLTGARQNYARKTRIPIDEITFNFRIVGDDSPSAPEDGVIVTGMFLEGAQWDFDMQKLKESDPKVLFTPGPMVWLVPSTEEEEYLYYDAPLYRTSERRGVLSTTGHSTNFVMFFKLNTDIDPKHWVKRGVALLTQLDDQ